MFCKQCGKEIGESKFCPYCGASQDTTTSQPELGGYQPINQEDYQQPQYESQNGDQSSIGFAILSFFIPLVGLILFLVWNKEYPKKAKSCLKGLITGVVVYVVLVCCLISGSVWLVEQYSDNYGYDAFNAIIKTIPYESFY